MSFFTMAQELTGAISKLPLPYAKTIINRAWADVRRQNLWSFQLFEGNWVSPVAITDGTVTTTQGLNTVTFDSDASAAIIAANGLGPFPTPLNQRQFRIGNSTIYNIWAVDVSTPTAVIITLDRPFTDASGASQTYMIYQCYYPAPYEDFRLWLNVRDIVNFNNLILVDTREEIDFKDPQRTIFYLPTEVVYYRREPNTDSPFYGFPVFELWGQILYAITYQLYGVRQGTALVADTDTLPKAVGEDCVLALSRMYAYEWAEANKGDMPRDQGSDYKFLMGAAKAEFDRLYTKYRQQDREQVDSWWSIRRHHSWLSNIDGYYNAIGASANPGRPW